MTYTDFLNETIESIRPHFSEDTTIREETIIKNNGVSPKALIICEPSSNIFPTIYLDNYFHRAQNGDSISDITSDILEVYNEYKVDHKIDISFFENPEQIKDRIVFRLVNIEKNEKLLENIPWERYLDLAKIFCIQLNCEDDIYAACVIHNSHMKTWNISLEDLKALSSENTPRLLPHSIDSLTDFLNEMAGEPIYEDYQPRESMYIMTNSERTHGATCMLYDNVLRDFSKKLNRDIIILPSSIHEVILLPYSSEYNIDELSRIVREINATQVDCLDFLSDSIYYYDYEKDIISTKIP